MSRHIWEAVCLYLVVLNTAGVLIMKQDKKRAIKKQWRIPERTMFFCALLGGSPGIWIGMQLFRHKTKHGKFVIGIPAVFILQCIVLLLWYMGKIPFDPGINI